MLRRAALACPLCVLALSAAAETVVATRTIRAQEIVAPDAVRVDPARVDGAYANPDKVVGFEARTTLYPGRPLLRGSVGPPALVDRNQMVELIFSRGGLRIATEGRALGRGGAGERIRVMNQSSRTVLFGTIRPDGSVSVASE
ncbi:flagellar basal body P-ring formation chaperone FlgA [Salipiger mucosus]|uniref:Flagella basal body P-ring formation protein FlgA n=1 Tax=Salipiger mucosus DSM 16094 TaxID=1123237 RepID=S9QMG8_9RHOB|nr:flagellar basal body P-ring formation chaperone FlgA [Salipiger mucosus]EPX82621.1 Flagellar basal-body P-ring formation protein FlgA [Salipiger mucosus DSM 16094]